MTRRERVEERTVSVRVVKLGGSLLEWPQLAERLRAWLAIQPPAANILIVGGGTLVDALRKLDAAERLPSDTSHWLAIRAMGVTAAMVASLLQEARLVGAIEQLEFTECCPLQILDVGHFLRNDEHSADALPASWDVTSDSISARVASVLQANELILLKSSLPAGSSHLQTLADNGYVDAYFPRVAGSLQVRCVNLRSEDFAEVTFE